MKLNPFPSMYTLNTRFYFISSFLAYTLKLHMYIYVYTYIFIYLSIYLSKPSIYLFIWLSICLSDAFLKIKFSLFFVEQIYLEIFSPRDAFTLFQRNLPPPLVPSPFPSLPPKLTFQLQLSMFFHKGNPSLPIFVKISCFTPLPPISFHS